MGSGPVANPFRFSAPVGIDDLIDRDVETEQLVATAREGNNARLVAPRRYGKTSLLRRVLGEVGAGADAWHAVYVDLFGVLTLADVADRVERAYAASLTGPVSRWFEGVRRTLRPTVSARAGPVTASADLGPRREGLAERLDLPLRLHERTRRRTLVVFDEFQELLAVGDAADAAVRASIQHHDGVASYIFAGSHAGMMARLFGDRRRAFYAQARPVPLPPLAPPDCAEFIAARFAATGKDVGDALGPLLDVAAGHPQRTMLLAHAVWDGTAEGTPASAAVFTEGLDRVLVSSGDEMRIVWSTTTRSQRRVLTALAGARSPYSAASGGSRGGTVATALANLVDRGEVLVSPGPRRSYRLVDPLLAEWLRRDVGAGGPSGG
jgi:uncharacterized protein